MCRIDEFWNIDETFPNFFFKTSKTETATQGRDSWFQIYNFEIRQIAFLMTTLKAVFKRESFQPSKMGTDGQVWKYLMILSSFPEWSFYVSMKFDKKF